MSRHVIEQWHCDGGHCSMTCLDTVERGGWPHGWFVDFDGRTVCPTCMARVLAPHAPEPDPQEDDVLGDLRKMEAWDTGR